jgi:DNA-binding response OmpR family regulator
MGQKTIAVVDDDPVFIEFMRDALTEEGYRVVWCLSAAETPALLQRTRPDLLIIDLHLEHQEVGWDLIELLRGVKATRRLPILVCSVDRVFLEANAERLQAQRCVALEKPFALEALLTLLDATLR